MKFQDIKQFPNIYYHVDIPLAQLEDVIRRYKRRYNLNDNPDFQRDYVWTQQQKISYIEYLLKNPTSGLEMYFNHPNWMGSFEGEMILVDGKQRLNAILEFLNNRISAYGYLYQEYEDKLPFICLSFNICKLQTRKEILQWYLNFNTGGTYHTKKEIDKVKRLIKKEDLNA
jgi:glutathionylspermidine synthase